LKRILGLVEALTFSSFIVQLCLPLLQGIAGSLQLLLDGFAPARLVLDFALGFFKTFGEPLALSTFLLKTGFIFSGGGQAGLEAGLQFLAAAVRFLIRLFKEREVLAELRIGFF